MTNHSELSDAEFSRQFANGKLDSSLFDHEAHLRLAWIHINNVGIEMAILNLKEQLKNYVSQLGMENEYNETLTEAAARAVNHYILQSKSENFSDFIKEFPRLKTQFKQLMNSHYSDELYTSEKAKETLAEPDLLPFD